PICPGETVLDPNLLGHIDAGRHHETLPLQGVSPVGRVDHVAVGSSVLEIRPPGPAGAVDLLALGDKRILKQRLQVLIADEATQPAYRRFVHPQGRAVAAAPKATLPV